VDANFRVEDLVILSAVQAFFLSIEQLDMGSVAATVCDDDVGLHSGQKPAKRQRTKNSVHAQRIPGVLENLHNFLHTIGKKGIQHYRTLPRPPNSG